MSSIASAVLEMKEAIVGVSARSVPGSAAAGAPFRSFTLSIPKDLAQEPNSEAERSANIFLIIAMRAKKRPEAEWEKPTRSDPRFQGTGVRSAPSLKDRLV